MTVQRRKIYIGTQETINLIRDNLQDRYKSGFPIVKELVQNADDGGASQCHLLWTAGLPEADHPLLLGPAIVVINDGIFRTVDADAIGRLGLSHRGSERASVGKFGLGLKSVFHLVEAFFYHANGFSDESSPQASSFAKTDIVHPWEDLPNPQHEAIYSAWNSITPKDEQRLQRVVGQVTDSARTFLVWLPLRRSDHCPPGANQYIVRVFPGDTPQVPDFLEPNSLYAGLAPVLPMLSNLASIHLWTRLPGESAPTQQLLIELEPEASRRKYPKSLAAGAVSTLRGRFARVADGSTMPGSFAGHELLCNHLVFSRLRDSDMWPRQNVLAAGPDEPTEVPDKTEPHAAVYFTRLESPTPELVLQRATFLPLRDLMGQVPLPSSLPFSVHVTLHACYFIDAGRQDPCDVKDADGRHMLLRKIEAFHNGSGSPKEPEELLVAWNYLLDRLGQHPLILAAMADFALAEGLTVEQVSALVQAFEATEFWQAHRAAICSKHQYVPVLASGDVKYALLEADQRVVEFPNPEGLEPAQLLASLPGLKRGSEARHVTFSNFRRLTPGTSDSIGEARLFSEALEDLNLEAVLEQDGVVSTLCECVSRALLLPGGTQVVDRAAAAAQEMLRVGGAQSLLPANARHRRFLDVLPTNRIVSLNIKAEETLWRLLYEHLATLDVGVIPVSAKYGFGPARMSHSDAASLLRWAASAKAGMKLTSDFACEIIANVDVPLVLKSSISNLELFQAMDTVAGASSSLSMTALSEARVTGLVFKRTHGETREGLDHFLGRALSVGHSIWRISPTVNDAVFNEVDRAADCTRRACLDTLSHKPGLGPVPERVALLSQLAPELDRSDEGVQPLRYLVHGIADCYDDADTLWTPAGEEDAAFWHRIIKAVLDRSGQAWRMVDPLFGQQIAPAYLRKLRVSSPDASTFTNLFESVDPADFSCEGLSDADLDHIVLKANLEILEDLPVFLERRGARVAPGSTAYVLKDFPLPSDLLDRATVLVRPDSSDVAARLEQLATPLNASGAIDLALSQPDSHIFAAVILDALGRLRNGGRLHNYLHARLVETMWLPSSSGAVFAPEAVIRVNGLDNLIAPLLRHSDRGYLSVNDVEGSVRAHAAWPVVDVLLPAPTKALVLLAHCLEDRPDLAIGPVGVGIDTVLKAFQGLPDSLCPAWQLLVQVYEDPDLRDCASHLLASLTSPIEPERLLQFARWLVVQHEAEVADRAEREAVYGQYLRALVSLPSARDHVRHLRLLNRRGKWKSVSRLCHGYEGISDDDVLDEHQADILLPLLTGERGDEPEYRDSVTDQGHPAWDALTDLLAGWLDAGVPCEVLGAFMGLFGKGGRLEETASGYLRSRALGLEYIRAELKWSEKIPYDPGLDLRYFPFRFEIAVQESRAVVVRSLLGHPFESTVTEQVRHLVVGRPSKTLRNEENICRLSMRRLDPNLHSPEELSRILQDTAIRVLHEFFWWPGWNATAATVEKIWQTLLDTPQFDIRVAQELLREHVIAYLDMLPPRARKRGTTLGDLLGHIATLKREILEISSAQVKSSLSPRQDRAMKELAKAHAEIFELITSDPKVQAELLDSIRQRISGHFQYACASIPFELFQNADDAVTELEMLGELDERAPHDEFHVWVEDGGVYFGHWGRAINQYQSATRNLKDRHFDRDLEKMLLMHGSDKELEEIDDVRALTGKFGLGFKTVFLASDVVEVVSDRLAFRLLGGMYPERLLPEEASDLRLRVQLPEGRAGTLFFLVKPSKAAATWYEEIFERFESWLPGLLVFAHRIKKCQWRDGRSGRAKHAVTAWEERSVFGHEHLFTGTLGTLGPALLVRDKSQQVLLRSGAFGPQSLPDEFPRCWVTTPLLEDLDAISYAFNADFAVDIGRNQLAREADVNQALAISLGDTVGRVLAGLYDAAQQDNGWRIVSHSIGLSEQCTPLVFWKNVWSCLTSALRAAASLESKSEALELARTIERRCLETLLQDRAVIPTGLPGEYDVLTRLDAIRYRIVGGLARNEALNAAKRLRVFQDLGPEGLVSDATATTLGRVQRDLKPATLSLATLIDQTVGASGALSAADALELGGVFTAELLDSLAVSEPREVGEIRERLRHLRFKAEDATPRLPGELLSSAAGGEEALLAKFATPRYVLHGAYRGAALDLFSLSRKPFVPSLEMVVEWTLAVSSPAQRTGLLRYLLSGMHGWALARYLIGHCPRWISDYREWAVQGGLSTQEIDKLSLMLCSDEQWSQISSGLDDDDEPTVVYAPPPGLLERIYDWWSAEGDVELGKYLALVYPEGRSVMPDGVDDDRAWTVLFLLGAFHTMGRPRDYVHRNFLEFCDREGWLDSFSDPDTPPEFWTGMLDSYFERIGDTGKWYEWLKNLPSFYVISRWLREYKEIFLSLDRWTGPFTPDFLLRTRSSPAFSGGGYAAPALHKTLGIGVSFVLREMARAELAPVALVLPHCFVPNGSVRRVLYAATGYRPAGDSLTSREVYTQLVEALGEDQADFDGAFDIPLQRIAQDTSLQIRFFGSPMSDIFS